MRTLCMVLLLLLSLLLSSVANAADDWTQQFPSSSPWPRQNHAAAHIGGDQVLLFGGNRQASGVNDETWVYQLSANTWTQQSPASNPPARQFHAMAYIGGDQVVLFGGYAPSLPYYDDTWVYDLSAGTWTQQSPASYPSGRFNHAMAPIGGDQVVLFGGSFGGSTTDDETWVYDLSANTWTLQSPSSSPSARMDFAMAYIGGDQVMLFGGYDASGLDDETWVYDFSANTWTQQSPPTSPSARQDFAMAYIGGDQVVLFGGWDGAYDNETWVYDLGADAWTQDANTTEPSARYGHSLTETSMDGSSYPVLFSGRASSYYQDTWTFGGGDYLGTVQATIDFEPYVLNLSIVTRWITCYIELPGQYSVADIELASVALVAIDGQPIDPIYRDGPTAIGDHDEDVIPDLMVTFDRRQLVRALGDNGIVSPAVVDLTVSGELAGGQVFEGNDSVWAVRFGGSAMSPGQARPAGFVMLHGNPLNPLTSETQIRCTVLEGSHVALKVYDFTGRLVRTLVDEHKPAGTFSSHWDGRDECGEEAPSGVYFYRLESGRSASTKRVVLTR